MGPWRKQLDDASEVRWQESILFSMLTVCQCMQPLCAKGVAGEAKPANMAS
jgi:hypothetical protein